MRVTTHVTAGIISRLPVPRPARSDPRFAAVVSDARALTQAEDPGRLARLNATVASLYELARPEFEYITGTFPLVPMAERSLALRRFTGRGGNGYHSSFL
jgi:hypothetical protein